jgi:hypothetical protein
MKVCFKRFFLLIQLLIADWPTPSALAAALRLICSTVSPVFMFVTNTALESVTAPASAPATAPASLASRIAGSCQAFRAASRIF